MKKRVLKCAIVYETKGEDFSSSPCFVDPAGKMSNFLIEDYDAVLKFINTGMPKKKLKL